MRDCMCACVRFGIGTWKAAGWSCRVVILSRKMCNFTWVAYSFQFNFNWQIISQHGSFSLQPLVCLMHVTVSIKVCLVWKRDCVYVCGRSCRLEVSQNAQHSHTPVYCSHICPVLLTIIASLPTAAANDNHHCWALHLWNLLFHASFTLKDQNTCD